MDQYRYIRDEINAGKDVKTVASELNLSKSRIYAMIDAMRKAGVTITLQRQKLASRFAHLIAEQNAVLPGSTAEKPIEKPKLTAAQRAEQEEALPRLRRAFNEPKGTYEELSARLRDNPVVRDTVEADEILDKLNAETAVAPAAKVLPAAPMDPDMQAKLNALFGQ